MDYASLKVEEFTSPNPITANIDSGLKELLDVMSKNSIRHLPVEENGELVGILSQRDVKVALSLDQHIRLTAADVMNPEPFSVSVDTTIEDAALEMSKRKIGSAIVMDTNGKTYGIFTSTDALNALIEVVRGTV